MIASYGVMFVTNGYPIWLRDFAQRPPLVGIRFVTIKRRKKGDSFSEVG